MSRGPRTYLRLTFPADAVLTFALLAVAQKLIGYAWVTSALEPRARI